MFQKLMLLVLLPFALIVLVCSSIYYALFPSRDKSSRGKKQDEPAHWCAKCLKVLNAPGHECSRCMIESVLKRVKPQDLPPKVLESRPVDWQLDHRSFSEDSDADYIAEHALDDLTDNVADVEVLLKHKRPIDVWPNGETYLTFEPLEPFEDPRKRHEREEEEVVLKKKEEVDRQIDDLTASLGAGVDILDIVDIDSE